MSEENVEIVREMLDAFASRDPEYRPPISEDIEWDATRIAATVPDLAGVYRGIAGHTALWKAWPGSWSRIAFDYNLRDSDDEVLALIRNQRQFGHHSGVVTEIPDYAWLFALREGKVVRGTWFPDHVSALEALGLSE